MRHFTVRTRMILAVCFCVLLSCSFPKAADRNSESESTTNDLIKTTERSNREAGENGSVPENNAPPAEEEIILPIEEITIDEPEIIMDPEIVTLPLPTPGSSSDGLLSGKLLVNRTLSGTGTKIEITANMDFYYAYKPGELKKNINFEYLGSGESTGGLSIGICQAATDQAMLYVMEIVFAPAPQCKLAIFLYEKTFTGEAIGSCLGYTGEESIENGLYPLGWHLFPKGNGVVSIDLPPFISNRFEVKDLNVPAGTGCTFTGQ